MGRWRRIAVWLLCCATGPLASAQPNAAPRGGATSGAARVRIAAGPLRPFYPRIKDETEVHVPAFALDRTPVTNGRFLAFVRANPRWERTLVSRLFADVRYLRHWSGPRALGPTAPADSPVTHVSWFAAKAYCQWQKGRLPTEQEWERVAVASDTTPDGRRDPAWRKRILDWYGRPAMAVPGAVGQGRGNFYGVQDLHGLVWEWVLDFNAPMLAGDARESGDEERMRFCGAGALAASEKEDYASFMRLAFRSSLRAAHTTGSLGFRCAHEVHAARRGAARRGAKNGARP